MPKYSEFYKVKNKNSRNNSPKNEEVLRKKVELAEYKKLIQRLGYAHFND